MINHPNFSYKAQKINPLITLLGAAAVIFAILIYRDLGAYATTMWDEWEYSRFARQLPLAVADVPYYLYYLVYAVTNYCGNSFLGCAQILNALFFVASLPFLYLVCRRTTSQNEALAVALLSLLGGITVYATHFMPEPMYFFGFWLWCWVSLRLIDDMPDVMRTAAMMGAGLAILSLVKLHALFLVPGSVLFLLLLGWRRIIVARPLKLLSAAIILPAVFLAIRLMLGFIMAGSNGLNIFGTAYGHTAANIYESIDNVIQIGLLLLSFLKGHMLAIATLFSVPCLIVFAGLCQAHKIENRRLLTSQLLLLSLMLPLMVVASLYTARMAVLDPLIEGANGLLRLHLRYYSFLFPLFVMIAATAAAQNNYRIKRWISFLLVALFVVAILSFTLLLPTMQLSVTDSPELRGFATIKVVAYALSTLSITSVLLWLWNARAGTLFYLWLFLPLFTVMGAGAAYYSARLAHVPNAAHRAGLFAKTYLGNEIAQLEIISPDYPSVYHAMFYADNPNITYRYNVANDGCQVFLSSEPKKKWMLLLGHYHLPKSVQPVVNTADFSLIQTSQLKLISDACAAGK